MDIPSSNRCVFERANFVLAYTVCCCVRRSSLSSSSFTLPPTCLDCCHLIDRPPNPPPPPDGTKQTIIKTCLNTHTHTQDGKTLVGCKRMGEEVKKALATLL